MGKRGPPPDPNSGRTKRGLNSLNPNNVVKLAVASSPSVGDARMPRWLNGYAREFWRRHAAELRRMGYDIIINPSRVFSLSELKPHIQEYRREWTEAGHAGEAKVGLRVPIYVSESAEQAYSEPRESALFSKERLSNRVAEYATHSTGTKGWQEQADRIQAMDYDDWLRDKVAYGTPDAVAERLGGLRDELGLSQIMFELNFGSLIPHERQLDCLRLFTEEVIPQLR